RQKDWIENKVSVMVCTNAFGMGIDKPDVRLVVHVDVPDCLENYYQEAGRAGRDGKKSYAVLLYDEKNLEELSSAHIIRFPSPEKIKEVYNALVNFLQIPANTGEYQSFNFRFENFVANFKLKGQEALYSLKALEQDGWIDFNEKSFSPASVVFTSTKNELYEFQTSHPEFEELTTSLLRTYGGILDFPAFISENLVARLLKKDESDIISQLQMIASFGIIRYTRQNEEPQIVFKKNRVPADDLLFNLEPYNKRKELYVQRVKKMIGYAKSDSCRSEYISIYFGDETAKTCGICDICLAKKSIALSAEEFSKIAASIKEHVSQRKLTALQLITEMRSMKKENIWKVLEFLQAENKIEFDSKGLLKMK
ncbi:MAG: helicase-related protein, partial [Flavisolibacter sp.]